MEDNLKGMTAGQLLHHLMDHFQSPEEQGYQLLDHAYKHLNPSRVKVCALTGCGRKVGLPPWTIAGRPEEYCSHACTDIAFQAGKKARQGVQVPAQDFGGLLTRLKCDVCGGSVLINWKSRDDKDCCSRGCQKKAEEDSMTTENETTDTTTTDPKPITAGAAAPAKKSGKKAAAKAATKAKATPKVKAAPKVKVAALGKFADEDVIHVVTRKHEYRDGTKRALFFTFLKEGQKVSKYKEVFAANKDAKGHSSSYMLGLFVQDGLVKISK